MQPMGGCGLWVKWSMGGCGKSAGVVHGWELSMGVCCPWVGVVHGRMWFRGVWDSCDGEGLLHIKGRLGHLGNAFKVHLHEIFYFNLVWPKEPNLAPD
jgi:hypothetical protein